AEPVTVGEPELAAGFLDDLRELTRNRAEKAVTGIDDFIRGVLRALWGRRALVLRACGLSDRGIARRRRIGLGCQGRTCQAEQDKGESDGPHHSAHRVLHWKWEDRPWPLRFSLSRKVDLEFQAPSNSRTSERYCAGIFPIDNIRGRRGLLRRPPVWLDRTNSGKIPPRTGRMKPRRQPGGHTPSAQQARSARSGGRLAAAWARGVQAGAPGKSGQLSESLRNLGAGQD